MKSQRVEALEEVADDLRYAYDYYSSAYFRGQFDEAVGWIEWNPELFPKKYRMFHRAIVRNTYFAIFYVIEPDVTTIVAVTDLRQWPSRIRRLVFGRQ